MGTRAIVVLALIAGCYDVPTPVCGFSCIEENMCPEGYTCMSADGFCHLDGYENATCPGHSGLDRIPPFVESLTPNPQNTVVGPTQIIVRFSEPVVGVSSESVFIRSNSTGQDLFPEVERLDAVNYQLIATFATDDSFILELTTDIRDDAGNRLQPTSFTYFSQETKPPVFQTSTPIDQTQNVSVGTQIQLFFDEAAPNILSRFHINDSVGTPVQYVFDATSTTQAPQFNLRFQLAPNKQYFATIEAGLADALSNVTTAPSFFTFTTGVDNLGPRIYARSPGFVSTGVPVSTGININFDEPALDLVTGSLQLFKNGVEVPSHLSPDAGGLALSLRPDNQLDGLTEYDVVVSQSITDMFGNACLDGGWSFQTDSDLVPPGIRSTVPKTSSITAPVDTTIAITFNEPAFGLDDTTFFVGANGVFVTGALVASDGNRTWTFTPDAPFAPGDSIDVDIEVVRDQFNNTTSYFYSFTIAP